MDSAAAADRFDVVAFGAHPDDLEVVRGGTAATAGRLGKRRFDAFVHLALLGCRRAGHSDCARTTHRRVQSFHVRISRKRQSAPWRRLVLDVSDGFRHNQPSLNPARSSPVTM